MGYQCSYGVCKSRVKSLKCKIKGAEGVFFIKIPSPKIDFEKCKKWVLACGRKNFTTENVDKFSYICSRHFHGFQGPTPENPDPIPLFEVLSPVPVVAEPQKRIRKRKRPRFESGDKTPTAGLQRLCLTPIVLSDLSPPEGWSLELREDGFSFFKLRNNFKVIEVILRTSEATFAYPVSVKVIENYINPEEIYHDFMIKSANDVYIFLGKLDEFDICPGNNDPDLVALYKEARDPPNYSTSKSYFCAEIDSVYSKSCLGLCKKKSPRCRECSRYRCHLRVLKVRGFKTSTKDQKDRNLTKADKKNSILTTKLKKSQNTSILKEIEPFSFLVPP